MTSDFNFPLFKTFVLSVIFLCFYSKINSQTTDSFLDTRDKKVYKSVTYMIDKKKGESITWMAENLNYKTKDSYCYDDIESNCNIMGRFYNWSAAMKACPKGWHLPNDKEWNVLANLFGGISSAGKHLKSTSNLWKNKTQGTNKSLFNIMPYGNAVIGSGYYAFKINATFWSSENLNKNKATDWVFSNVDKMISYKGDKLKAGNSVRCVKN